MTIKVLNWIQRGTRTFVNLAKTSDGREVFTMEDLAQTHQLNIMESERRNQAIVSGDGLTVVFQSDMPYNADRLLAAVQAFHPDLASVVMDPSSLGSTSTTTTTTGTTTTTTGTTTTGTTTTATTTTTSTTTT